MTSEQRLSNLVHPPQQERKRKTEREINWPTMAGCGGEKREREKGREREGERKRRRGEGKYRVARSAFMVTHMP